jgi:hypothetical protein
MIAQEKEQKMKNAVFGDEYAVKQYEKECDLLLEKIQFEWDADGEVGIIKSIYFNLLFFIVVTPVLLILFMVMFPFNIMQWFSGPAVAGRLRTDSERSYRP